MVRSASMSGCVVALALAVAPACASAQGCMTCDSGAGFVCAFAPSGGYLCTANGVACAVAFPCPGVPPRRGLRDEGFDARPLLVYTAVYDVDAASPVRRTGGRVLRGEAADFALARLGAVVAREGYGAHADRVLDGSVLVSAGSFAAAVQTPDGEGYAMRVQPSATGYRVVVRAVEQGRLGRVLVSDFVGGRDLLLAPTRADGRPVVIAMRVTRCDGSDAGALRDAQLRFFDDAREHGASRDMRWRLDAREPAEF
jgi:hypothetical protein